MHTNIEKQAMDWNLLPSCRMGAIEEAYNCYLCPAFRHHSLVFAWA